MADNKDKKIEELEEEIENLKKRLDSSRNSSNSEYKLEKKKWRKLVKEHPDDYRIEMDDDGNEFLQKLQKTYLDRVRDFGKLIEEKFTKHFKFYTNTFNSVFDWVGKSWGEAQDGASQYAKAIGMSAEGMDNLRKRTIEFVNSNHIGTYFNTSMKELIKLQQSYNQQIGRTISLTNSQLKNMSALKLLMGEEQTVKFTANFEKFGLDANVASEEILKMFNNAQKKGLVFQSYSEKFLNNIDLAQRYTFADGVRGLSSMAEKATAIKLDLQQTAAFAEKVNTVEGAIKTGAGLSVLGGSFARFSNPMGMLYESLNDLEGLQDRLIGMFSNLGRWDSQKGQVDISAFNRMRIRAASQAMGIDYGKMIESINAQGRRNEVAKQLNGRTDIDKETRELILNTAQLDKNGNAFVEFGGESVSVKQISNKQREELKRITQTQAKDIKDIAKDLRSLTDTIEGRNKQYQATKAKAIEKTGLGKLTQSANNWFAENGPILTAFLAANTVSAFGNTFMNIPKWGKDKYETIASIGPDGEIIQKLPTSGSTATPTNTSGGQPPVINTQTGQISTQTSNRGGSATQRGGNAILREKGYKINNSGMYDPNGNLIPENRAKQLRKAANNRAKAIMSANAQQNQGTTMNPTPPIGGAQPSGSKWGKLKPKFTMKGAMVGSLVGTLGSQFVGGLAQEASGGWKTAGNIASSALAGAGMGAMFGVPGALIGAALGAAYGGWQEYRNNKKIGLLKQLEKNGISLRGDYSISELKKIIKGQVGIGGEGSELYEKMAANGDDIAFEQLGLNGIQKLAKGGLIVGKSHAQGGVAIGNSNIIAEGGEFVVKKEATARNLDTLVAINNDKIIPTEPLGKQMKVSESAFSSLSNGNIGVQKIEIEPIKFDLSGNINLSLNGASTKLDGKDLLNNTEFVRQITNIITKRINEINNKSFVKENYWRKLD